MVRGSGIAWDLRRSQPYECYDEFDFKIPLGKNGDCYDRYLCRMREMRESTKIIQQAVEKLDACRGEDVLTRGKIAPPRAGGDEDLDGGADPPLQALHRGLPRARGRGLRRGRGAEGRVRRLPGVATARNKPYKVKLRAPGYPHLAAMDHICRGHMLADVSAALGSLDIVFGEVDR